MSFGSVIKIKVFFSHWGLASMLVIWKSGATETIDRWQAKVNYSEALWRYAWVRLSLPVAEHLSAGQINRIYP